MQERSPDGALAPPTDSSPDDEQRRHKAAATAAKPAKRLFSNADLIDHSPLPCSYHFAPERFLVFKDRAVASDNVRQARMLQSYELMFWDAMAGATMVPKEYLARFLWRASPFARLPP
jgi:hypothetical protein